MEKNDETNKNSFEELYNELYKENYNELEKLRKKSKKAIVIVLLVVLLIYIFVGVNVLGNFVTNNIIFTLMPIIIGTIISSFILVFFIYLLKNKDKFSVKNVREPKSYNEVFKEKIIKPLIKNEFSEIEFKQFEGISRTEYNLGEWEYYDIYKSEDMIIAKIDNGVKNNPSKLTISEVHTQNESTDEDGHTTYTTVFHGLAGYLSLPYNIDCNIKITRNKIKLFGKGKNSIEMDMSEFEKMFDVKTTDKIKTMQLLTSDVMMDMINFVNEYKIKFELNIKNDIMYIRFHTGGMFEPSIFSNAKQMENVKKYLNIVTYVINVSEKICKEITNANLT